MKQSISRRSALKSAPLAAGAIAAATGSSAEGSMLSDVWGEDFLTQWSPPGTLSRTVTPGSSPVRLSCASYRLNYEKGMDFDAAVKYIRDAGYTACESTSDWNTITDSEIRDLKTALDTYDVWFYCLHVFVNNIHPDMTERRKNHRLTIQRINSAERLGLSFIVTHTGSRSTAQANFPHRDNWTREAWRDSVDAMKYLITETAGSPVNLGVEALNPTNINNPRAHVRLKEDVGNDRIRVTLDPTNMLNSANYYRMTELLYECFDLLGEDIMYAHAKDVMWEPRMLPRFEWVIPGEGSNDFGTFLKLLSRRNSTRPFLLEFLQREQYPAALAHLQKAALDAGVTIYG